MIGNDGVVHLIEDDEAVRDAIVFLMALNGVPVRSYDSAESFLAAYQPRTAECVVADVLLPRMNGLELQQELLRRGRTVPLIFITGHGDVPMATQAMKRGAVDFIQKPIDDVVLLRTIEHAIEQSRQRAGQDAHRRDLIDRFQSLTPREREVMERVTAGASNKRVAADLGISPRTVEIYRRRVMDKMGARSLAALVHCAAELISDPAVSSPVQAAGSDTPAQ
jgi:FixJ family two-component response regulator